MKRIMTALLILAAPAAMAAVDATEVGPAVKEKTGELKSKAKNTWNNVTNKSEAATEKEATFKQDKAFPLNGQIEKVSKDKITIARPGLPPAELNIRDETMVLVNGKRATSEELQEGAQVRARFQLEHGEPIAVRLDMNKSKATGGAGQAGSSQNTGSQGKAQNAQDKAERGAQQTGEKAQQGAQEAGEKTKSGAQQTGEKAKDVGQDVKDTSKNASQDAQNK